MATFLAMYSAIFLVVGAAEVEAARRAAPICGIIWRYPSSKLFTATQSKFAYQFSTLVRIAAVLARRPELLRALVQIVMARVKFVYRRVFSLFSKLVRVVEAEAK